MNDADARAVVVASDGPDDPYRGLVDECGVAAVVRAIVEAANNPNDGRDFAERVRAAAESERREPTADPDTMVRLRIAMCPPGENCRTEWTPELDQRFVAVASEMIQAMNSTRTDAVTRAFATAVQEISPKAPITSLPDGEYLLRRYYEKLAKHKLAPPLRPWRGRRGRGLDGFG